MIDCDIHNDVPRPEALFPYLPEYWVEHITNTLFKGPTEPPYPPDAPIAARPGARPDNAPPGSNLDLLCEQALDAPRADLAILNCLYAIDSLHNPDAAIALASAVNDWQRAEWLEKDARLRASIVVPSQLPAQAAREIDRVAEQYAGFVQVLLPARSQHPYGNRLFHPLWEAAARHDLVIGIHFGGSPGNPPTPSGWPSYFFEEYAGMATVFASQVTSMVCEGVFDQFPTLRVALLESGFTWLPAHMWRFDKEWRNLRRLVPWVKQAPSEYIRRHFRLSIQPLDAPADNPRQLLQIVDQLGSEDMLMYASDYPHVHAYDPETVLLQHVPESLARKIRHDNARALYNL